LLLRAATSTMSVFTILSRAIRLHNCAPADLTLLASSLNHDWHHHSTMKAEHTTCLI